MKKWHMEGIIGFPGNYPEKIVIPEVRQQGTISVDKPVVSRKDSFIMRMIRFGVRLFIRYF